MTLNWGVENWMAKCGVSVMKGDFICSFEIQIESAHLHPSISQGHAQTPV